MNLVLLTQLGVEVYLQLEFRLVLKGPDNFGLVSRLGGRSVEELASTALLHDVGPAEPRELAKSIRTVDDGEGGGHLGIAKHKIAV